MSTHLFRRVVVCLANKILRHESAYEGLTLKAKTILPKGYQQINQNLIYDIGWVMGDLRNATAPKIERRFFVKEFLPISFWKHTFVNKETGIRQFWKIDSRAEQTQRHAFNEPTMVKSWDFIMGVLHADVSMVDCVGSYNWAFDSRAIDTTNRNLNHSGILPTWEFNSFCLQYLLHQAPWSIPYSTSLPVVCQ